MILAGFHKLACLFGLSAIRNGRIGSDFLFYVVHWLSPIMGIEMKDDRNHEGFLNA